MPDAVDILGERVVAAADLIVSLRHKVSSLEQQLQARPVETPPTPPSTQPAPPTVDPELVEELERLRAERAVVRETIRGLLREIDRVAW